VLRDSAVQARGSTDRVFSLQTPRLGIQVAQGMAVRCPMARTRAPLRRPRSQLVQRRADDLAPLGQAGPLPDGIRPRVHGLNGLFGRLQHACDAQKRFVADAAHELRLPLAALTLQVQGPACAADDDSRQRAVLRVLLRNLPGNAVKYTPAGGRVDVTLQRQPGALCLRVEDSGPGIAEAGRERVFGRFYRAPGAAASAAGNGLGLAIVKAIADSHGARLAIGHSERLGGLSVELRLPAAPGRRRVAGQNERP